MVERVENGPAFGVEFKCTEINRQDAFMLGGYAGAIFDGRLFIGAARYWQIDSGHDDDRDYFDYDDYGHNDVNGYGGLLLEVDGLRTPVVSVSARGLIGGGVTTVGGQRFDDVVRPPPQARCGVPASVRVLRVRASVFRLRAAGECLAARRSRRGDGRRRRLPRHRLAKWGEDQIEGPTGTLAVPFGGR